MAARQSLVIAGLVLALLATEALGRQCRGFFCRDTASCNTGITCRDCSTRQICTIIGRIDLPCWLPGLSHCADGRCVSEPTPECNFNTPHPTRPTSTAKPTSTSSSTTEASSSTTEEPSSTTEAATTQSHSESTTDSSSSEASTTAASVTDSSTTEATRAIPSTTEGAPTSDGT